MIKTQILALSQSQARLEDLGLFWMTRGAYVYSALPDYCSDIRSLMVKSMT